MTAIAIDTSLTQSQLAGVGILLAAAATVLLARRERLPLVETLAGFGVVGVLAVVGARTWSVAVDVAGGVSVDVFAPTGFASAGAFVGAAAALLAHALVFGRAAARRLIDAVAPASLLGLAFVRAGCVLAGCHRGVATGSDFGVRYPDAILPVHPFGLYLGLATAVVALVTMFLPVRRPGRRGALALIAYGVVRFVAEFWRDPTGLTSVAGLHTGHAVALAVAAAGVAIGYFVARADDS